MGNEISKYFCLCCTEDINDTNENLALLKYDEKLTYVYDCEKNDKPTWNKVKKAQCLKIRKNRNDWNSKYNIPEPNEMHAFAKNVYANSKIKIVDFLKLESHWKHLYCVRGTVLHGACDGFYGELYFNTENHYLLVAIKGTSSLGNVWSDIKNVGLQFGGGEIDSAFTFGEKVRKLIMKFKCKPMLIITGHSLGGYLAQITTYTLKYCYLDKAGRLKPRETPCDDFGIYTVVFDSPAALKQIIKLDQRDPIRPEILLLPIVNFIVDVNIINSNSVVGPHLGQVVAVKSFEDLNTPSKWERTRNAKSFHGIKNFQEINIEEFCQVENLPSKKSIKYDPKTVPSCMFSVLNFERLHKYLFLEGMFAELANKLPKFKLSNSRIVIEDENVKIEEFIPRVHHFLAQYKDQLDSGKFGGKQNIDMVVFCLWRAEILEDAHELGLNEEYKQRVEQLPDGTKIGGFESYEEMRFVGCLLYNTIPRCFYYDYQKFLNLDEDQVRNFATTTKLTLVLIVKEKNQIILHKKYKEVKIVYLVLDSDAHEKMDNLVHSALDENSQEKLKNTELHFMGHEVPSKEIIGEKLIENLQIWSIYSMKVRSALTDKLFYCNQEIASVDKKKIFISATEFAIELSRGELKFVLISSKAGMGKSTALKQIAKTLQKRLQNYWIVHLNMFSVQGELNNAKEKLISKAAAIEFVRNAALGKRKEDQVLKNVFDWKVEAKEMVFLLDSLDEICPNHRDTAKNLLALLKETELQIVVTTRPHEGKNFDDAEIFSIARIKCKDRNKFVSQKCKMMEKLPPSDISSWFKKIFNDSDDNDLWRVPLILNMAIDIFDPTEVLEAVCYRMQKTYMFETFINKSISNTLKHKMNYDQSLAAGCYSEKFELYNNLIQILAICTIFHSGEVALAFQKKIEKRHNFINRFDIAKVDDCNKVAFMHRSFAEYLVARLFVQNTQAKSGNKIFLDDNQSKCILFKKEFSDTRKHICTILAMNSPKSTSFSGFIINGEENLLLSILIEEDRYELYLAFKDLLRSQLNKTMMAHEENAKKVETSPLYYALIKSREEFVQQLVSDGAQFEAILSEKDVLHLAIEKGLYKEVIYHFKSLKSNIHKLSSSKCPNASMPLQIAAKKGSRMMVEFLIEEGADVNYADTCHSALYHAIEADSAEIIKLLIIDNKAHSAEALTFAAELNRKDMFDIIYEKYTPSEYKLERLRKSLLNAAEYGHLELFKHLTNIPEAQRREVKENVDTFLHIAAERGHFHCIDFIFEYQQSQSIDVKNAAGQTPLMRACSPRMSKFPWSRKLIYGERLVLKYDPIETVEWLLKKNANVNVVDNQGMSCMHHTVSRRFVNIRLIEILLNAGAEINLKDDKGWTPLFYAISKDNFFSDPKNSDDVVKCLLKNTPADAIVRDNEGNTCLHIASKYGAEKNVKLLLEHLPVNCENLKGETPLHWAAYEGHDSIVKLLLEEGAKQKLAAFDEETIHCLAKKFSAIEWNDQAHEEKQNNIRSEISSWRYIVRDNNLSS